MFKVKIKTPEQRQYCCSGIFIVNLEHISHLFLVFLLLTLTRYLYNGCLVGIIPYLGQMQKTPYPELLVIECFSSNTVVSNLICSFVVYAM